MQNLLTIISSIGFSGLLTAALIFLSKNWISERIQQSIRHEYEQKLETHKAKLKAESDKEIEELKARLQVAASERSIRLSHVFETTANVLAKMYGNLVMLNRATRAYTKIFETEKDQSKADRRKSFDDLSRDFINHFEIHKIYLPKRTAEMIEKYHAKLWELGVDFFHNVELPMGAGGSSSEAREKWMAISKSLNEDLPVLLNVLTDDFRQVLGMNESDLELGQ